jgi:pyrimidine deaminase RibD-like protein
MSGIPALYCRTCRAFREVERWHERGEALVIALEPCGHQIRRPAGIEWAVRETAA